MQARREFAELDLVYRTLPFALSVFDRELRFLQVNEQASRAHGISAAAHAGLRLRDVTPNLAEPMEKYLRQVFETGESIANIEIHGTVPSQPDENPPLVVQLSSVAAGRKNSFARDGHRD